MPPIGSLDYLQTLFYLAISDMVTGTGGVANRLAQAHSNQLYKIEWHNDIHLMPEETKEDFLKLKELLSDNIKTRRKKLKAKYEQLGVSSENLSHLLSDYSIISNLHWRKAKEIAQIITNLYFSNALVMKRTCVKWHANQS